MSSAWKNGEIRACRNPGHSPAFSSMKKLREERGEQGKKVEKRKAKLKKRWERAANRIIEEESRKLSFYKKIRDRSFEDKVKAEIERREYERFRFYTEKRLTRDVLKAANKVDLEVWHPVVYETPDEGASREYYDALQFAVV